MGKWVVVVVLGGFLLCVGACSPRDSAAGGARTEEKQKSSGQTSEKTSELTGSITVKGSDTMVNLGQAWAEEFMKRHPKVSIAVTGGGSGTGITALINGTCDIAQSSRPIDEKEINRLKEQGKEPREFICAIDAISVVVNPANPVDKMTIQQLSDIFTGKIKNWKDVGGEDKEIIVLSRDRNSGTHVFFLEHVVRKGKAKGPEEYAPTVLMMPSTQAICDEVAQNRYAIGYIGLGYLTPKQKALAIASKSGEEYIKPSNETASSGKYPISRFLYFYTVGLPSGALKEFIDFCLSRDGQEIVKKMDFVPLKEKK
ncbi:MAG: phosphate ABC transporter substrate-binding protein [Planctomycetota bacterium]|nr:phosphate ABC transporter substrate-binding protein [Planctomycetota bacterium]